MNTRACTTAEDTEANNSATMSQEKILLTRRVGVECMQQSEALGVLVKKSEIRGWEALAGSIQHTETVQVVKAAQ